MKVRKIGIFTQLFIWLAVLLLVGNALLGYFAYTRSERALFTQIQNNVMNIARCAAMNVDGEILQQIAEGDEESESYELVIQQLALFRDNADIEYIYTLRQTGESSLFLLRMQTRKNLRQSEKNAKLRMHFVLPLTRR